MKEYELNKMGLSIFKLTIIILILTLISQFVSAQEGNYEALFAVDFVDKDNGWAVGRNSVILHTSDGGKNWDTQYRSAGDPEPVLIGVAFSDINHGVAIGRNGLLLVTDDGGVTWDRSARIKIDVHKSINEQIEYLQIKYKNIIEEPCPDDIDTSSDLIKTDSDVTDTDTDTDMNSHNNGKPADCHKDISSVIDMQIKELKEQLKILPEFEFRDFPVYFDFKRVYLTADGAFVLSGGGQLYISTDNGLTWDEINTRVRPNGVHFLTRQTGFIVTFGGGVHGTVDGGKTWQDLSLKEHWNLEAVYFRNNNEGWVGGEGGSFYHTVDGGKTWRRVLTNIPAVITGVKFVDSDNGFVSTFEGVWITNNGGLIWNRIELPLESPDRKHSLAGQKQLPQIFNIDMINSKYWVGVGTYGLVMKSNNSGFVWKQLRSEIFDWAENLNNVRSIENSGFGWSVDFGYANPAGKIRDRFGSGLHLGMDFLLSKGRWKFGAGYFIQILVANEYIKALPGDLNDTKAETIDQYGVMVNFPFYTQVTIFEKRSMALRVQVGVGPVYHCLMATDNDGGRLPNNANYDRDRFGIGAVQNVIFGWYVAGSARPGSKKITRSGWYFKLGLQESWTWGVGGKQTDLGTVDKKYFGTELWPYLVAGFSLYF